MRKEVWFGLSIMAAVVIMVFVLMPAPSQMTNGHLGLLMLALIVVGIMLGFPTAFTLMGMGVFFGWLAYRSVDPALANRQILDLMVQRAYSVMSNDVLIAIPLFVFMGYLVERAALIDRLFKSLHLATARVPGALAVATIVTCAIFATATGIVGAVVTLMGLLAFPAMLKAGYNTKVAAGAVTAGGCLGILIPPSVLLIVYGAVAGVSVVQLYAGAFGPGIMLAGLYIGYVIVLAKFRPDLMPPLPESDRSVALTPVAKKLSPQGSNALTGLWRAFTRSDAGVPKKTVLGQLVITLVPALFIVALLGVTWRVATAPDVKIDTTGLVEAGAQSTAGTVDEPSELSSAAGREKDSIGLQEPPSEPEKAGTGLQELYIKDDSVNHPTLSYKDRVVSMAATRAVELGFTVFGCASTGNLANSVSSHAARLGLECYVFIPNDLELGKVLGSAVFRPHLIGVRGNYDDVNRLCTQIADKFGWGFANINLRSYYAEGAKTVGFEVAEQLGWRFPQHLVSPVAGGTLLPRILRGFRELVDVGLVDGELPRIHAAQAAGCAPVVRALQQDLEFPEPVKPATIAKSIAIGNPADGFQVVRTVKATGGTGVASSDEEILQAMELLAETEGVFTEPAGGATLAGAIQLVRSGVIGSGESVVVCITGNGYKTAAETIGSRVPPRIEIGRSLEEFETYLRSTTDQAAAMPHV